jgi:uncharacterized membrane protein (UPF0127 family)
MVMTRRGRRSVYSAHKSRSSWPGRCLWLFNQTRSVSLAHRLRVARTFAGRLVGLLDQSEILPGHGLLLSACRSIHTHFMRFPIDALYVDTELRVVAVIEKMRPFRTGPIVKGAAAVIELPAGTVAATGTKVGDRLGLEAFPSPAPV